MGRPGRAMGRRGLVGGRAPLHLLLLCHAWALPPPPRETQPLLPTRLPAPSGQLALRLAAFGRAVVLRLRPDAAFLAPRLRLQRLGGRRPPGRSPPRRGCFYAGAVEGSPDAPAVLSRCGGGLRAAFLLDGEAYELQPLGHPWPGPPWRRLHRLQRRAAPPGAHPAAATAAPGPGPREPLRRAKRFVSQARYVETLLVADASMVRFYGEDVEQQKMQGEALTYC
ncbi:disintegrin/metalloproteinase [Limosa lapponica baueri]|uniref:Disintegrin/metalloproteinase n=1 Tax=Limosa lapponica baueri TaxID=1758121 RepID=A0A2I0T2Y8_LIMLA|nr:disintegrin/metalloproteinase [Limosa lapponica baueri]